MNKVVGVGSYKPRLNKKKTTIRWLYGYVENSQETGFYW